LKKKTSSAVLIQKQNILDSSSSRARAWHAGRNGCVRLRCAVHPPSVRERDPRGTTIGEVCVVFDLFSPSILVAGHEKHDEGASKNGGIKSSGLWPVHTYHSWPAGRPVGMGARPRRRRFVGRQQQANHQPRTNTFALGISSHPLALGCCC
jgi:hypothetical protein